ncbi:MAG TPA: glycosyltransferase family 4 protein [Baekduia sp.]|uniref:glycosyltransferase family 4 protein n=1 Tax=Baekduia sp. TaxID=2600305 RepID=UPI002CC1C7B6|nr:glycosyltransferase family 4 protein [Baekduia sp.]HMJ36457.1 glycosyltransferase family 4 protein [Baekduia sp.]
MRIVYFTDTEQIGGAERHVADLAAGVAAAGHDVLLLAPQDELLEFVRATSTDVEVRRAGDRSYHGTGGASRAVALARGLPGLRSALRGAGGDLLHVNNGGLPGSDLCRVAPRLVPRPRVMTINSMPWDRGGSRVQAAADRFVWSAIDAALFPSLIVAEAAIARRGMPRGLLRHLRYGVRMPDAAGAEELRARLAPDGELLVGMVSARAVPEKGYDVFVDALAQVPGVRGVLVGPHLGAPLEQRIRDRGVEERLALIGAVPAVNAYDHAIDVLVMPSVKEEAMPLVMLEAMAAGKPIVASRLSGTPEAIEDGVTGALFAPGDVDALAALLRAADADRDLLARQGAAGHARWRELFSPEALVSSHVALYEQLVGRR